MHEDTFSIRTMDRAEVDIAADWAAAEGWNPGIYDADCFYAAVPDGFLIGLLNEQPVAMVSAVAYGDSYGFMGFYIVKPEIRNREYGVRLWDAGLRHLANRCIGLDSVRPDLVSRKKPEFQPAYVNFRLQWIKDRQWPQSSGVIDLSEIPFSTVAAYDREVFGFERQGFLKCWISRPGTRALGIMKDDNLVAYGVIRECRVGYKIGPLFSDQPASAVELFQALTAEIAMGQQVYLDTPGINRDAVMIATSHGMTEVFRTTRMYNGPTPALPLEKWFGVTSFELG